MILFALGSLSLQFPNFIMKKNLGPSDSAIRFFIAVGILILFLTQIITGTLAMVLLIIGAILLLTGLTLTCPLYAILGINTCREPE